MDLVDGPSRSDAGLSQSLDFNVVFIHTLTDGFDLRVLLAIIAITNDRADDPGNSQPTRDAALEDHSAQARRRGRFRRCSIRQ